MSSKDKNLSFPTSEVPNVSNAKIGVITAEWNDDITLPMRDGCIATLHAHGCTADDLIVVSVPGAYELPIAAKIMLANQKMDAIICIGCVIKGETKHDQYISRAVAEGIMNLSILSGKPIIFGVLTPNNHQQAVDRSKGKHGNKGIEAAHTALKMIDLAAKLKNQDKPKIGY